ncbi:hypothetical protein OCU04_008381 [Sclerotinia nivalis]|uniref:ADP-ribose 1''-phosphate phosphatase n=1 Tax=Sclerotinia nivalis TaxID=352851 RepID=A0A9X0DHK0_9HELO|nr:hypothetical protein OCU04_008381 [Sclerotinia nivalis]
MNTETHFPLIKKPPIPPPSKPTTKPSTTTSSTLPTLSRGLLLSSSSSPLAPLELRLASLPSYPCTAIVSPISQSPSQYPLHPPNTTTSIPSSPLSSHASPSSFTPRTSLPGLIDHLAGEELVRWREKVWPDGLNVGGCGVCGSFGLGGGEVGAGEGEDGKCGVRGEKDKEERDRKEKKRDEGKERPKYIIHTHAPNFADKTYSTPLVKQLLVNCYRGVLVEGMWIAEREEEKRRKEEEEERRVKEEKQREKDGNGVREEVGSCGDNGEGRQREEMESVSTANEPADTIMTDASILEKTEEIPETPTKTAPNTLSSINLSSSISSPANLSSPRNSIPSIPQISTTNPQPHGITIAIPALSTGHKSFPHRLAARIAVGTVRDFLLHPIFGPARKKRIRRVVFCVWPVDSPNRKALQIAFGLMFPPPLPQSAPLSPVSTQLATPPFSPSPRRGRGGGKMFDFGGRNGVGGVRERERELEVEVEVQMLPRIVVTPPVTPVMLVGGSGERKRERERVVSPLLTSEGGRTGLERGDMGVSAEDMGRVDEGDSAPREGPQEPTQAPQAPTQELPQAQIRKENAVPKGNTEIIKELIEKGKIGRASRGRKETYKQRKRKQGLRLAAAMRVRRERERERGMERWGDGGGVGGGDRRGCEDVGGNMGI